MNTAKNKFSPMKLKAPVKDYIWGGTKLRDEFGKASGNEDISRFAESWELSSHPDGESIIDGGEYDGRTLSEFLTENPAALKVGNTEFSEFPVLIKLIDAKDDLSVQVHPDNDYARKYEGDNGKTEMWYIIDCDEGAELIYGFKNKITKEEFQKALEENTILEMVNRVKVHKGDVFFIKPGTLHAIGGGILIAEIQQSSNVTYRVYDYGRVGDDGKPRELHIQKALDVTRTEPAEGAFGKPEKLILSDKCRTEYYQLCSCEYFTAFRYDVDGSFKAESSGEAYHILVIDGEAEISGIPAEKGSSIFVPAGSDMIDIKGRCSIILTRININNN